MDGYRTHYDFVRPLTALGVTPAVAAGTEPIDGFQRAAIRKVMASAL